MPIINIQRRLHEAGRIRIGEQVEFAAKDGKVKKRPHRLDAFRFTSRNVAALEQIAALYGGEVVPWEGAPSSGQWEVVTTSSQIKVIVPPTAMGFSQSMELWSGGGCVRRCDGVSLIPGGEACECDPESPECKPHTRLSVMLVGVQGTGMWRLDTQGYYAATELAGAQDLAQLLSQATSRAILPGTLRLDQREVKRPGEPLRQFAVPVLDFDVDLSAVTGATASIEASHSLGLIPVPEQHVASLATELEALERPAAPPPHRANAAEPVRPTGAPITPRGPATPATDDDDRDWSAATVESRTRLGEALSMLPDVDAARVAAMWKDHQPVLKPAAQLTHQWEVNAALSLVMGVLNEVNLDDADDAPLVTDVPGLTSGAKIETPRATEAQVRRINASLRDFHITDRDKRLAYVSGVIGRDVTSTKDLTKAEASKVIDQLNEGEFPAASFANATTQE